MSGMRKCFTAILLVMLISLAAGFSSAEQQVNPEMYHSAENAMYASSAAKPKKVTISGKQTVVVGKKITLKASVSPSKASQNVTWKSSNSSIATVSSKGVVKGIKEGNVTITATSKANKKIKASYEVTVKKKAQKNNTKTEPDKTETNEADQGITGLVLPDPLAFFQSMNYNESPQYLKSYQGNYCSLKTKAAYAETIWEYADCVIANYPYELSYSYDGAVGNTGYHQWDRYLTCIDAENLAGVSDGWNNRYTGAHVYIGLGYDTKNDYALLFIVYSDGIRFQNDGFHCTRSDIPDIGRNAGKQETTEPPTNTTSPSDPSTPSTPSNPSIGGICIQCNGKGYRSCHTCGGDGTIEVYVKTPGYGGVGTGSRSRVSKKCSNIFCHGGKVDCLFCQGTGKAQ